VPVKNETVAVVPASQASQAAARDFQAPLAPLPIVGAESSAPAVAANSATAQLAPATQAAVSQAPAATTAEIARKAPVTNQAQTQTTVPTVPVVPAASQATLPHISEVAGRQVIEPASGAAAQRALSTYDKAWNSYDTALRLASAGSLATSSSALRASVSGLGAAAFLSGEGQATMARATYVEARLAWDRQASNTLAAAGRNDLPKPDATKEAQAVQRLNQAADLVSASAGSAGSPTVIAQVRTLLEEADQLHRAWVAEWAKYLAELGA